MKGIRFSILVIAVCLSFCWTGCLENQSERKTADYKTGSNGDMMQYLQRQNLPPLESVEKWTSIYGDGLVLTTNHYKVYTTLLDPLMLSQVPGFMESAHLAYQRQLPDEVENETKFTVYIFANRSQWERFTKTFTGNNAKLYLKIKAGAYYLNGCCVAYNIGRKRTFSILGHEGWHQFNNRHFKYRLPSWLDEGIAMQFEASRYEDGLFFFEPTQNLYRLGSLKQTLLRNKMMPLRELISKNPGEVLSADEYDTVTAFYSQAYALIRFLKEDSYGKRLGNYYHLMKDGLNGDWPFNEEGKKIASNKNAPMTVQWNQFIGTALFDSYIGDLEDIEEEYIRFCRKIVYHVHPK